MKSLKQFIIDNYDISINEYDVLDHDEQIKIQNMYIEYVENLYIG